MLVLEMGDDVVSDDDSEFLYQAPFLETNIIRVTFLAAPFPLLHS